MLVDRNYPELIDFIKNRHSVLVLGPRGSGKTFFLRAIVQRQVSYEIVDLLDSQSYIKYMQQPWLLGLELGKTLEKLKAGGCHYIEM